jgi:NADH:ubiquinone oxidoreductase subunit 5 (subunit L)/multisubunit Na+/H+ antiporter MnhA subunit
VLFCAALATAALTAFYTFRAYFMTFWGAERIPHEAGHHAHESPRVMTVPLMILAVGALLVGYVNAEPLTEWLSRFLEEHTHAFHGLEGQEELHIPHLLIGFGGMMFALSGIALAWWMYLLRPGTSARWAAALPGLYQLSLNKFYIDELYYYFLVQPLIGLAQLSRLFDVYVVDALVNLVGLIPRLVGHVFRPIQNGLTQFYGLAMALGLTMFLIALAWRLSQ